MNALVNLVNDEYGGNASQKEIGYVCVETMGLKGVNAAINYIVSTNSLFCSMIFLF